MDVQTLYDRILELIEYQMTIGEYRELESYTYSEWEVFENLYTREEIEDMEKQIKKCREQIENAQQRSNALLGEIWFMIDYLSYPVWFDLLRQIRSVTYIALITGSAKATLEKSPKEDKTLCSQMLCDDEEKLDRCKTDLFACIEKTSHEI